MAFGGLKGTFEVAANSITNPTNTGTVVSGSGQVFLGDLVYVVVGEQTTSTATGVTDNLGNTYTATQAAGDAGTSTGRAFYARVTVPGTITNIAVAATGSTQNVAIVAVIIEGPVVVSPLDANPTNGVTDVTSPFTCPATGTLAQAQEIVIAWAVATGSNVWAATAPNLLADQIATQAILHTVIGYQAVNSTSSVAPEFTGTNPTDQVLGTSSFKRDMFPIGRMLKLEDWPNPKAGEQPISLRSWYNRSAALLEPVVDYLPSVVADFGDIDVPDPIPSLRTWVDQASLALKAPVQGVPVRQTDWPVPKGVAGSAATWVYRASALLAPVARPFSQTDWSVPRSASRSVETWTDWPQLTTPAPKPFPNTDWPVPQGPGFAVGSRTWIQGSSALAAPVVNYLPSVVANWPEPLAPTVSISSRTWTQQLRIPAPAAGKPFSQTDWPIPRGPAYPTGHRTFIGSTLPTEYVFRDPLIAPMRAVLRPTDLNWTYRANALLAPPAVMPPTNRDWPIPRGYATDAKTWTQRSLQPTVALPPSNDDWPNPKAAEYSPGLRTWVQRAQQVVPPNKPFTNTDWPNVRSALYPNDLRTWAPRLNALLAAPVVDYLPSAVAGSSAPDVLPQPGQSWTYRPNALLAPVVAAKPFSQTDWPNPKAAVSSPDSRTWAQQAQLAQPAAKPFGQFDWPNVKTALYSPETRTWVQRSQLVQPAAKPFFNLDWPNPRVAAYSPELRTWAQRAQLIPPVAGPKPFTQADWVNPRGPVTPIGLRDWVSRASLSLLQSPNVPPEPAPAPIKEVWWPVTKNRREERREAERAQALKSLAELERATTRKSRQKAITEVIRKARNVEAPDDAEANRLWQEFLASLRQAQSIDDESAIRLALQIGNAIAEQIAARRFMDDEDAIIALLLSP